MNTMKKLALCAAIVFLLGSNCEENRLDSLDEGYWQIGDVTIHPEIIPIGVWGDGSLADEGLDTLVEEVAAWWNTQLDDEVWFYCDPTSPDIEVTVNYIALDEYPNDILAIQHDIDLAEVRYSIADGVVASCNCTLNIDLAYDYPTMTGGLRHCLGHCLGLADDPGIDVTVDLRSIMSNPLDPLGVLTPRDRTRLLASIGE